MFLYVYTNFPTAAYMRLFLEVSFICLYLFECCILRKISLICIICTYNILVIVDYFIHFPTILCTLCLSISSKLKLLLCGCSFFMLKYIFDFTVTFRSLYLVTELYCTSLHCGDCNFEKILYYSKCFQM